MGVINKCDIYLTNSKNDRDFYFLATINMKNNQHSSICMLGKMLVGRHSTSGTCWIKAYMHLNYWCCRAYILP